MEQDQTEKKVSTSFTAIFLTVLNTTFMLVTVLISVLVLPPDLKLVGLLLIGTGICIAFLVSLGIVGYLRYRKQTNQGTLNTLELYIPPLTGKTRELRLAEIGQQLESLDGDFKMTMAAGLFIGPVLGVFVDGIFTAFYPNLNIVVDILTIALLMFAPLPFQVLIAYKQVKLTKEYKNLSRKEWKLPYDPSSVEWVDYGM